MINSLKVLIRKDKNIKNKEKLIKKQVLKEMEAFSKSYDEGGLYVICRNYFLNKIEIRNLGIIRLNVMYFESVEMALTVIDTVGRDRIKKYYLGVYGQ